MPVGTRVKDKPAGNKRLIYTSKPPPLPPLPFLSSPRLGDLLQLRHGGVR